MLIQSNQSTCVDLHHYQKYLYVLQYLYHLSLKIYNIIFYIWCENRQVYINFQENFKLEKHKLKKEISCLWNDALIVAPWLK